MGVRLNGVGRAIQRLQALKRGLDAIAGGDVTLGVTEGAQAQIDAIGKSRFRRHTDTGYAAGQWSVEASPKGLRIRSVKYLRYHRWWPFRKGLPGPVIKKLSKAYSVALSAALEGRNVSAESLGADVTRALEAS